MNNIELNVEVRSEIGKSASRRVRAANRLPGIFYGPHMKSPIGLAIDYREFSQARSKATGTSFFKFNGKDANINGKMAMIREQQVDPVSSKIVHVDFYEVRMDEKLKVNVPISYVGKSIGVAEGGLFQSIRRSLEVRCLPKDVPQKIEVDISNLGVAESIHMQDIKLPDGVSVVGQVNYTLATVVPPEAEEVQAAVAATPEGQPVVAGAEGQPAAAAGTAAAPAATAAAPAKKDEKGAGKAK